jgi:alpha,alpha-trehalase
MEGAWGGVEIMSVNPYDADRVIRDLRELAPLTATAERRAVPGLQMPIPALEHTEQIVADLSQHHLALCLDYDGTLTPIVDRPEQATLSEDMRSLLARLAERCTLAIISGRDRQDVQDMVRLDHLIYAGSHGFDIAGPDGLHLQHEEAKRSLPDLDRAEQQLRECLANIEGVWVERKRFAIAVHARLVADKDLGGVEKAVTQMQQQLPSLRQMRGKKVLELQPDVGWDKGQAILWLREALGLDRSRSVTIYMGDDVTDEDAFRAVSEGGFGLGIRVASPISESHAHYALQDCDEVQRFLRRLFKLLSRKSLS